VSWRWNEQLRPVAGTRGISLALNRCITPLHAIDVAKENVS
jgi:hypothetical protein